MKKSVFESIHAYLNGDETVDLSVIRDEVNAEWDKMVAKKQTNIEMYATAKEIAFGILSSTPKTVKEIYAASTEWPQDFTVSKLQYAFRAMWNDKIVKHDNGKNPFTYSV